MVDEHDWDADFRRNAIGGITVTDLLVQSVQTSYAPLQEMVERMFTSVDRAGIVIVFDSQIVGTQVIDRQHFRLDPKVPFGHIYKFESMDAYELWQEWGSPQV